MEIESITVELRAVVDAPFAKRYAKVTVWARAADGVERVVVNGKMDEGDHLTATLPGPENQIEEYFLWPY